MSAHAYRRLLVIAVVLGMAAGLWLLPRGFSFGATVPPQPIELRSGPPAEPSAPVAPAPPPGVDDDDATDDDGDDGDADRPTSRRADLRGQQVDAPATGNGRVGDDDDDDDDDDGPDDSDDDEADDDDEGDDD